MRGSKNVRGTLKWLPKFNCIERKSTIPHQVTHNYRHAVIQDMATMEDIQIENADIQLFFQ